MKWHRLEHRFLRSFPEPLEPGIFYVSIEFGTTAHSCCCGCGEEVVIPLTPTGWKITFDGEAVSLWPSVGSWTLPCGSHYVIDRGRAVEGGRWNSEHSAAAKRNEKPAATEFAPPAPSTPSLPTSAQPSGDGKLPGWWLRLYRRLFPR